MQNKNSVCLKVEKMEIKSGYKYSNIQINNLSVLSLAFIGDSVHTMFVRDKFALKESVKHGDLNKVCSKFCKAKTQAKVFDLILNDFDEFENDIARRARNTKTNNIAKNSNLQEYKKATSFEAVIGYLYLTDKIEKLKKYLEISTEENL